MQLVGKDSSTLDFTEGPQSHSRPPFLLTLSMKDAYEV